MRWDCDKRKERRLAKREALKEWHPVFVLFPHKVAENDCRWLETIERRKVWYRGWILVPDMKPYEGWKSRWEYRSVQ